LKTVFAARESGSRQHEECTRQPLICLATPRANVKHFPLTREVGVREHQGQLLNDPNRRGAVFTVALPPFGG